MHPWIARNLLYRPATWLRREPVFRLLREYDRSQWWDADRITLHQRSTLDRLLAHASARSSHYRERARELGREPGSLSAADLPALPLLTKRDLVERGEALRVPHPPGSVMWKTTGGSTGVAVRLTKNRYATATEQAASWRAYGWYGVALGDRQARFWGTPLTGASRLRSRAIDWILNRDRFSAFAFRRSDLQGYFDRLRHVRPVWAYGYVSMLAEFARYCLDEGLPLADLGLRAVVTTSEALGSDDRALIQRGFGCPVFNEYGCGEVGAVLYECERGALHLMAENLVAELLPDPTEDRPDAHRLVLTDLHNFATPLIRYDVGDRVVPAPACACGRALPAFSEVIGRAYDFVSAPDGTRFHGEFFMYALEEARDAGAGIHQAQFVQCEPDRIRIHLVPGPGYEEAAGRALAEAVRTRSEDRFRVEAVSVEALERERSGKIRLIKALPDSPTP